MDGSLLGADFDASDLTASEQKQYQKILELRERRAKQRSGGKGPGSSTQLESLEQSLYDR